MKSVFYFLILCSIFESSLQQVGTQRSSCPISDNPSQVFQCLTLNPQAFVDLISKNDFKSFCHMANGYMTCMSTYIRDCLLGKAASGILEELQDLNLKCCISGNTQECLIKNPALLERCFSSDNTIKLGDGTIKSIMDVKLGDVVKAVDSIGDIIDSEVVSILHKESDKPTMFQVLSDKNNKSISLSSTHLLYVKDAGYIFASKIKNGDALRTYSYEEERFVDFVVDKIDFQLKIGYIAPLTNEGTILVNNIDASCFAMVNNHWLANIALTPLRLYYKISKYFGQTNEINDYIDIDYYSKFLHSFATHYTPSFFT